MSWQATKNRCNCGKYAPALEHNNTCPTKAEFILYMGPTNKKEDIEELFKSYGYKPSVTIPHTLYEMIQCDCKHWFPRWEYDRCPVCKKPH